MSVLYFQKFSPVFDAFEAVYLLQAIVVVSRSIDIVAYQRNVMFDKIACTWILVSVHEISFRYCTKCGKVRPCTRYVAKKTDKRGVDISTSFFSMEWANIFNVIVDASLKYFFVRKLEPFVL